MANGIGRVVRGKSLNDPSFVAATLEADDLMTIRKLLADRSRWFDEEVVHAYENAFARWNGSLAAFAFMGGRAALSAAIAALGLRPGDEVIIPGYTCIVVPNAFAFAGVKTVCADIELDTYGLDASAAQKAITPNTRAILLHHLYGLVCRDYEAIIALAQKHGIYVIEDCTHSTGAEYKGMKVGNLGTVAFYSSEHSKVFTTGQGGLVTTNDAAIAARLRNAWEAAESPNPARVAGVLITLVYDYYKFAHPRRWLTGRFVAPLYRRRALISTTDDELRGRRPPHYGQRMPGALAVIGRQQLAKVDRFNARRRESAKHWDRWCENTKHAKPTVVPGSTPIFLRYPVLAAPEWKRDSAATARRLGTPLGVWFAGNYHPTQITIANCPHADEAVARCINFPTL